MQSGSTTTSARSSWSAARVIPDEVAKELLSQNELEMDQLDVQKGSVSASVLTTGDVIEKGLAVLNDWGLLTEVQPDTRQRFQRFLFPEGMTIEESGFGTSAAGSMPCCESVTVSEPSREWYSGGPSRSWLEPFAL